MSNVIAEVVELATIVEVVIFTIIAITTPGSGVDGFLAVWRPWMKIQGLTYAIASHLMLYTGDIFKWGVNVTAGTTMLIVLVNCPPDEEDE